MSLVQTDERLYGKTVHSRRPWRNTKSEQTITAGAVDASSSWVHVTATGTLHTINDGIEGMFLFLTSEALVVVDTVNGNIGGQPTAVIPGVVMIMHLGESGWEVVGNAGTDCRAIREESTDVTVTIADATILVDATSANRSVFMLPCADCVGQVVAVKKIDASGNTVTLDGDGGEQIDGAGTYPLSAQYEFVVVQSDGAQWWRIG